MKMKLLLLIVFSVKTALSQSILSVTPNTAQSGETSTAIGVVANNTFWNTGAGIYYVRLVNTTDTVYGNITNLIDDTHLECTFFIQGSVPSGCYDVQTYDLIAGLVTLPCSFTITAGGPSSSIVSITPDFASAGGIAGPFDVTGYNTFWNSGAGLYFVRLVGYNDTINMYSLNSITDDTHVNVSFFIPDSAVNGCYDVQAYDLIAGLVNLTCGFNISGGLGGTAGIENNNSVNGQIKLYPNPASNSVSLDLSDYTNANLVLSDITGKILFSQTDQGGEIIEFDISNFEPGIYLIRVECDGVWLDSEKLIID